MKYVVYIILFFCAGFLFLPRTGTTEIRNQPLLILILSLILILILIRFFKYVVLMAKTQKLLKKHRTKLIKIKFFPWTSRFHGHYSITFQHEKQTVQLVLLSRKKKYQRYHFERIDRLEFYRANRVVFKSTQKLGGIISHLVEINQVGKQRIKWEDSAELRIVLFDKLPDLITDSVKKEPLGVGDRICASDSYVLDWSSLSKHIHADK